MNVHYSHLTPLRFLERSADVFREKPAVVHGDVRYTYPELRRRVNRLASAFRSEGVRKGDRIAYLVPNIPALLEAHYAVPQAGAALVAINVRLSGDEIAYILNHSQAKILVVDTELARLVEPVRHRLETVRLIVNVADQPDGVTLPGADYEAFLASGSDSPVDPALETEEDLIAVNYTSGTTGRPKGVMYSHRGAYLNALAQVIEMRLGSDSVYLWTLPMFHCNGWCYTWGVTTVGATHVCLRKVDAGLAWQLIRSERVTHLCGAPVVLIALVNHPDAPTESLPQRLRIATGGAPPAPATIAQVEPFGAELIHLYGLTETYGPATICEWQAHWSGEPADVRARLKARQGVHHVIQDHHRVVDEQMRDVPADGQTIGELVLRGNTVMLGYFDDPAATAEAFRGGWLHSGDLAVRHPDGYVELRDRKKDIIISGGENISTIEVENALYLHPAILEVAVVAAPDEKWGEVPKAFVTLKPGQTVTESELTEFCRGRLAHFKCPKSFVFGDLPKTSTGKIQKFVLREQLWAGREKRIQ